jgi:hypothetical protein
LNRHHDTDASLEAGQKVVPAGTDGPSGTRVEAPGEVREVALSPVERTVSTLSRVDYTDAFLLETERAQDRTGEEWTRAILEDAPAATRRKLRRGWFALGVRLGSTEDSRLVLGWEVRRSTEDVALLAATSLIGMDAEVLCKREQNALLVATFMQLKNPVARAVWAAFAPRHRKVLRHLIRQAGRRSAMNST